MATWYIATTGNDTTGDGSSALPWLTISKAHTAASSGDTVICKAGTYTLVTQVFSKSLTIQGETGDPNDVIFDAGLVTLISVEWSWSAADLTSTIQYIKFCNVSGGPTFECLFQLYNVAPATGTYTFNNCIFDNIELTTDAFKSGGLIGLETNTSSSHTLTITSCLFNNIKKYTASSSYCFMVGHKWQNFAGVLYFHNNTVYLSTSSADTSVTTIVNVGASPTGLVSIKNNIFYCTNALSDVASGNAGAHMIVEGNCYYNTKSYPTGGTGDITSDPLFVDAPNSNFNLRPSSPAIDTGTTS